MVRMTEKSKATIRLATRGSKLALTQTQRVADAITRVRPDLEVELVTVTTAPDVHLDRPVTEFGNKGAFVFDLEDAIREGKADAAVHSMKDVPGDIPEDMAIVAVAERVDPRDALVSRTGKSLENLPPGAHIGTSSVRRAGQLLRLRPDLNIRSMRGNVDSRLRRLREGGFDGIIVAAAGMERLGISMDISENFSPEKMVPAAGQGMLCVEAPVDSKFSQLWSAIDIADESICAAAERAFIRVLGADCHSAAGCLCTLKGDRVVINGMVCSPDGKRFEAVEVSGKREEAEKLAEQAAEDILKRGGEEILRAPAQ
jgi:hydroxymethylbilane synthase